MHTETVWLGRSNSVILELQENGHPMDLSAVTRATIALVGGAALDSAALPGAFDWTGAKGWLTLRLGEAPVTAGLYRAQLTLYALAHAAGLVFPEFFLEFKAG